MDDECKHRENLSKGMEILLGVSKESPESEWIRGKIKSIVDKKSFNEHGILVEIREMFIEGHVKKILEMANSDDGLTDEEILQTLKQIQEGSGFETTKFELKETLWYDINKSKGAGKAIRNFKLEYEVVDEVCALLNTSGGYVLIGVTNDGIVKGITEERDLQWMSEREKDLDHFADMISKKLELNYFQDSTTSRFVTVKPRIIEEKAIIVIKIRKSYNKPWFVHRKGIFKDKKGIETYLRGGTDENEFMEYFIRRETGITNVPIDEFMKLWNDENKRS